MSPSTSPLTTKTTATTTASTARPASPGYRLLTPSELSKILNHHHNNHSNNSQAPTSLIPTLPIASSSSSSSSSLTTTAPGLPPPTSISSLHHHHLQPPSLPNHAPKPLIPSSTPLTPEGSTTTSSFLTGMNIPAENDESTLISSGGNNTQVFLAGVVEGGGRDQGKLSGATTTTATLTTVVDESRRTLCVRHQSMADQGINGKLQQSLDALPMSERAAITSLWSTFSSSPHPKRKIILEGILTMCCFSQLSHLSESLSQIIRVDPFSLFPKEVSLKVLGFLDAISLGKAAQVSRGWRELADDDLLWRRMCGQHIERKCTECGWGLPLLERRRLRMEEQGRGDEVLGSGQAVGGSLHHHHHHRHHHHPPPPSHHHHHHHHGAHIHHAAQHAAHHHRDVGSEQSSSEVDVRPGSETTTGGGSRGEKRRGDADLKEEEEELVDDSSNGVKRRRIDALDPSCPTNGGKMMAETTSDSEVSDIGINRAVTSVPTTTTTTTAIVTSTSSGLTTRSGSTLAPPIPSPARTTRRKPWKHVYCERLMVERNWRKGRPIERILKGHTNGVMCLQVQHNLSTPSYPVLITGSYDKTVKVWNLDTGEVVRTLVGHTRSVKTLQFDQAMLVTGSADKTLRVWNWRTGECLRVLEGHTKDVMCLHYDRNTLASGSADATVKIWNMKTGSCFVLRGHTDMVNSVSLWDGRTSPADRAFNSIVDSPVGVNLPMQSAAKFLFSASDDGTIKMWDLASKSCLRTYAGHTGQIQSIRVLVVDKEAEADNSDEDAARSGGRRGRSVSHMDDHRGEIVSSNSIAGPISCSANFAPFQPGNARASQHELHIDLTTDLPDDKQALLVSGALDNTIKVWDVETGLEKSTLFGHIEGVWAVDVDSLRMASASHAYIDRTIKIWDRESGRCARTLVGHRGAVTSLQLSDDMIVSGSEDGEVRVWSFAPAPTNTIQPASYTPPAISTPATSI